MEKLKKQFAGIDKALKEDGLTLRVFRSRKGLKVVRIEEHVEGFPQSARDGKLRAYGEHPHLREALMLASTDHSAGGGTTESHYLIGSLDSQYGLDNWVLCGHDIVAQRAEGGVRIEARTRNYERIILLEEAPTFAEAYSRLDPQITSEHIDEANYGSFPPPQQQT